MRRPRLLPVLGLLTFITTPGAMARDVVGVGAFPWGVPEFELPGGGERVIQDSELVDLDNDGDLDAVTASVILFADPVGATVRVMLNDGVGRLEEVAEYPAGTGPRSVAAADLNGDGWPDVVAAATVSQELLIYLGHGDGTLAMPVSYPTGGDAYRIALGDVDDDGDLDVGVSNWTSSLVSVFLNDGAGAMELALTRAPGAYATGVVFVDYDTDGDLDLGVMTETGGGPGGAPGYAVFYRNNGGIGDDWDGFEAAPFSFFPVGLTPTEVVNAELNGVPGEDLCIVNYFGDSVSVLLSDGVGGYLAQDLYAGLPSAGSVAVADIDHDGDLDMLCSSLIPNLSQLVVFRNDGSGVFADRADVTVGGSFRSLDAGDMNGDGEVDAVYANAAGTTVTIAMGLGGGGLAGVGRIALSDRAYGPELGDVDGDGDLDLVYGSYDASGVIVMLNNGDATFATELFYPASGTTYTVRLSDLDGDGDLDIVSDGEFLDLLFNDGAGSFGPPAPIAYAGFLEDIVAGDMDGDGDPDLVGTRSVTFSESFVSIWRNDGGGAFGPEETITTPIQGGDCVLGDFDNDGDLDVAAATYQSKVLVLLNDAAGALTLMPEIAVGPTYNTGIDAADIDGDGDDDLVVVNASNSTLSVLRSNSDGAFAPQEVYGTRGNSIAIRLGDVNGDGAPDIVVPTQVSFWARSKAAILMNDGAGNFDFTLYHAQQGPTEPRLGDLDGDGDLDFLTGAANEFALTILFNHSPAPAPACPGDVTGDQMVDVADLNAILSNWLAEVGVGSPLDLAGDDGVVNVADLNGLLSRWQAGCG